MMMKDEKKVITRERHKQLVKAEETLLALQAAGVDNWEGYSFAINQIKNNNNEKEP